MVAQVKKSKLSKELNLFAVFTIVTGGTLSGGFFLLPGLAAQEAGPAVILAYLLAAVPLIPAMFSIIELATAMPRAGGVYFFLDRTMGPLFGTIGGIGTWLALILKVAFALIGIGAYTELFFPDLNFRIIAIVLAVIIGVISLFGSKKSGWLQGILVSILLILLTLFIAAGAANVDFSNFKGFFDAGAGSIFSTAGLVYISYVGITKVASLSEEVKDPERNLPTGIIIAISVSILFYILGTGIMVGVLGMSGLAGNLTPVASAAGEFLGDTGVILVSIAAIFSFISVANAGTLSASRYPLAMSRDHIMPGLFRKLNSKNTPSYSVILTSIIIISILILVDPTGIAKLASAFQLLIFSLVCLAVVIMRESGIQSYDPGYKSPLYPYMQIFGIISPLFLITEMGIMPVMFSSGLVVVGLIWYKYYAQKRVRRSGAIYHIFEKLGRSRYEGLDIELRTILKEKGLRTEDQFEEIVMQSHVIDLKEHGNFDNVTETAAEWLSGYVNYPSSEIKKQFLEGTKIGATPVTHGVALPHLRINGLNRSIMVLVRGKDGIKIKFNNPLTDHEEEEQTISAIFYLVSPENNPTQHLRILAQIAGRVDEDSFRKNWFDAVDENELKEALIRDERFVTLYIRAGAKSETLIGKSLKEVQLPKDCLATLIKRENYSIIPNGESVLLTGDRVTIIGNPRAIEEINKIYVGPDQILGE